MSEVETHEADYRLDTKNQCLRRITKEGTQEIALRPKAFEVLRFLIDRAGQLVTKNEVLEAVWADVVVGEEVLKGCVRELRQALGDSAKTPRFIKTLPRRGYRFIGSIPPVESGSKAKSLPPYSKRIASEHSKVFGREAELSILEACLYKALAGERQIAFVSGDNGIGKTALVRSFLQQASRDSGIAIAHGQCQELYGKGEAYMPVLEALERVGRETGSDRLVSLLHLHAPMWLMQMPSLVAEDAQEVLLQRVSTATSGRMLREIAQALEALTLEMPLVLVLEDLHWSDYSTIDFISALARQQEPARLLLIGTYRPAPIDAEKHPLKAVHQHLLIHRQCVDVHLSGLNRPAVAQYLTRRLEKGKVPAKLLDLFDRMTGGNPLFVVTMVEDLLERGSLALREGVWQLDQEIEDIGIADTLQQMIQEKLEALSSRDRRLLEVASVAGMSFSAAVVAAAMDEDEVEVGEAYAGLVRRGQFLRRIEEGAECPDGMCFAFNHALHQSILYQRLTVVRQVELHRRIGEALETGRGEGSAEVTAELAIHFERGRRARKAVEYHVRAAQKAVRQSAYREAVHHLNRALDFMKLSPDNEETRRQELALQVALGRALVATRGYGVEEVGQSYMRATELARQLENPVDEVQAMWGLAQFRVTRGQLEEADALGKECLMRGSEKRDADLILVGHRILGMTYHYAGQPLRAREHLEAGLSLGESEIDFGPEPDEPLVFCRSLLGLVLWVLGYADQAVERCQEAVAIARRVDHPMSLACARQHLGMVHYMRREVDATRQEAEALLKIANDHGLPLWSAGGKWLLGWARSISEPLAAVPQLCQALASWRSTGARLMVPTYLATLASAFDRSGDAKMGLSTLAEALEVVNEYEERVNESEILRLKGKLLRERHPVKAETCLREAIAIAKRQGALSWQLWATVSLCRLLAEKDEIEEAYDLLSDVYGRFREGFGTVDLKSARNFLDELSLARPLVPS